MDEGKQYRLTCYISWSPCPDCAQKLVEFLDENRHVSLHMFPAGIQTRFPGYEDGLRDLRDAGAELAIMTLTEHQHCWEKFVDHPRRMLPLKPKTELEEKLQKLKDILRFLLLLPATPPLSSPLPFSPWACLSLWVTCSLLGPSSIPPLRSPLCDSPRLCSVHLLTCLTPCFLQLLLFNSKSGTEG
ncbi:DNA dC-_dU-editing enzyme APOBEC-3G [Myotis brandtii]|uniref:DNA dC->dU-editing enzyme APOBEC-3G n=1 Tax=Myotis brandtii TaxID=109478 RepID=S7NG51_MYOBR|nr:DNA dC->dU-editing enzyme APOBEC-3G [Myotis brandtii]